MRRSGVLRAFALAGVLGTTSVPQAHNQQVTPLTNAPITRSRLAATTATVVGTGTAASCTPVALTAALTEAAQSGGTVTFNCGIEPVSIVTTGTFALSAGDALTVDGSALITLDAAEGHRLFSVPDGGALTLRNVNLIRGRSDGGGAIFNAGSITLDGVRITQSFAVGAGAGGGAIGNDGGAVLIQNSTLAANGAESIGGAISSQGGSLTIDNSSIEGNQADTFGALDIASDATLLNTIVRGNVASGGCGGGIGVQTGQVTIADSTIVTNSSGSCGGGVYVSPNFTATVTIRDTRVVQNSANPLFAGSLGGGIFSGRPLTLTRVTVDGNAAYSAGGLWQYGADGALIAADSTFKHNTAVWAGGAMELSGGRGHTLTNVTISSNSAGNWGGGIGLLDYPATLRNVTLSGNAAPSGANVYVVRATATLANSIASAPSGGDNCGSEASATPFASDGYNLVSDGSCALAGTGDQSSVDPLLGALADNEQGMLTHLPQAGSPAIDFAPAAVCPERDQRGYARPAGAACDAGAIEVGAQPPPAPELPPLDQPVAINLVRRDWLDAKPINYPISGIRIPDVLTQIKYPVDLSICMYRSDLSGEGSAKRARYEAIFGYFADAVYEMTNGAHIVRYLTVNYSCNWPNNGNGIHDDIIWLKKVWPYADALSGYGVQDKHIYMADIFSFPTPFTATLDGFNDFYLRGAGYTMAHELGHFMYGIADEYSNPNEDCDTDNKYHGPCKDDVSLSPSVMSNQFRARNSLGGSSYAWLNFSTPRIQTKKNAQYRIYQADGWTTLARPSSKDPQEIYKSKQSPALPRYHFRELAAVAPGRNTSPTIELPASVSNLPNGVARRMLKVIWRDTPLFRLPGDGDAQIPGIPSMALLPLDTPFHRCLACPENIFRENRFVYPNPAEFNLQLRRELPVAGAQVIAEVTAPDNSVQQVPALDDGTGNYRAQVPYAMGGRYQVTFRFVNAGGKAFFTNAGVTHTPAPDGSSPEPVNDPVGVPFTVSLTSVFTVTGFQADDHINTVNGATLLLTDDEPVMGRIDQAGDADVFVFTAAQDGDIVVRVLDLTAGMRPRIVVARGGTIVADVNLDPASTGYVNARLKVRAGEMYAVTVTDLAGISTGAHYQISAGAPLDSQIEIPKVNYLPLVRR